jgi:hypothetical protein
MGRFGAANICEFYDKTVENDITGLIKAEAREQIERERQAGRSGSVGVHDVRSAFKRAGNTVREGVHEMHELYDDFSDDEDGELRMDQLTEEHIPARVEKVREDKDEGSIDLY